MTDEQTWARVDDYLTSLLLPPVASLDGALAASDEAGLPPIQVSAPQGALLELIARMVGARNILEIGTLGGYSTLWLARGLVDGGRVVSLEVDQHHADTARASFTRAGLSDQIEVRVGPAADSLSQLRAERDAGGALFDLVFIDADKISMPQYFVACLGLVRPGGVLVADNVVRAGRVADAALASEDASVRGVRGMFELISVTPGVVATAIQTVGSKGYDGFALIRVEDPAAAEAHHRAG
jgi:predicted O-methyltransferase YrrM